jgi:hypothetical protein
MVSLPNSKHLAALAVLALILIVPVVGSACGGGDQNSGETASVTASASPSASPTASPTEVASGTPTGLDDFRSHAEQVKQALLAGDVSSVMEGAVTTSITCKNELGICAFQTPGAIAEGLPHIVWQQDTDAVLSIDDFSSIVREFLGTPASTPPPGYPKFDAIVAIEDPARISDVFSGKGELFGVVLTSVVHQPEGAPPAERAMVLLFEKNSGEWRLAGDINSGRAVSDWTSGSCERCYDAWEVL